MMIFNTMWAWVILYGVLCVILLGAFVTPGFVFLLDMSFTPTLPQPDYVKASYPYTSLLHYLSLVIPGDVIQKILLFVIVVLAGIGMHMCAKTLARNEPKTTELVWYFAGILYVVNPFVYSRFMAGHSSLLLGYALLPFFLRAVVLFLRQPTWQKSVIAALWLVAIGIVSIHTVGIALLAAVIFAGVHWWPRRRNKKWLKATALGGGLAAGIATLASSYWLIPALFGQGKTVSTIANFNAADLTAFATNGNNLGLLGNVLALQGFWADAKDLYLLPQDVFSWWLVPLVALWVLVAYGIYISWQQQRGITAAFVALIVTAAVLAIGTAGTIAAPLNQWLIDHIPFFVGYREPQKFVMLIALAYAYFAAVAVAALAQQAAKALPKQKWAPLLALPLLLIPPATAPLMLNGFAGQLTPRHYPQDWYAINDYLQTNAPGQKVLFLPWRLYANFSFAGRVIANPADKFFANPIVTSNDPQMGGAKSYTNTPDQQAVQYHILPSAKAGGTNMAAELHKRGIRYIILAKELDFTTYSFLDVQPGLVLLKDTPSLKLLMVTSSIDEGV